MVAGSGLRTRLTRNLTASTSCSGGGAEHDHHRAPRFGSTAAMVAAADLACRAGGLHALLGPPAAGVHGGVGTGDALIRARISEVTGTRAVDVDCDASQTAPAWATRRGALPRRLPPPFRWQRAPSAAVPREPRPSWRRAVRGEATGAVMAAMLEQILAGLVIGVVDIRSGGKHAVHASGQQEGRLDQPGPEPPLPHWGCRFSGLRRRRTLPLPGRRWQPPRK